MASDVQDSNRAAEIAGDGASAYRPSPTPAAGPIRIVSYAWGEKYIDEFLSVTLPALMAPGNLPWVAAEYPCELVLLTEERFFERVLEKRAIRELREICGLRLMGLDDLLVSRDRYGVAVTYSLHRSFADLGSAMTNAWLVFLNADFVLADGSLKTLLRHLAAGARIVASPSYCVNSTRALPVLRKRIGASNGKLSMSPREMARLILEHRHTTIRAKTINQRDMHIRYMDQFYWLVDDNTLLGHQMPIAIVGLRPERPVAEPNSFWDHGFIRELCPTAEVTVLGDSDDFLMLELRDSEVAQDQIEVGWPKPREIGERMIVWVTPYQRDFARYPLTLHASELPPGVPAARRELESFIDQVLSYAPRDLPSHLGHPQWAYHWGHFTEARHASLSKRLGSLTETRRPPDYLSEIDRIWWLLDGKQKARAKRLSDLRATMDQQISLLNGALATDTDEIKTIGKRLLADIVAANEAQEIRTVTLFANLQFEPQQRDVQSRLASTLAVTAPGVVRAVEDYEQRYLAARSQVDQHREHFQAAVQVVRFHYQQLLDSADRETSAEIAALKTEYERLFQYRSVSAAIPMVQVRHGVVSYEDTVGRSRMAGSLTRIYRALFGRLPYGTMMNPYWAPLQNLLRVVESETKRGAKDVLIVGTSSGTGVVERVADHLPGVHVWASFAGLTSGNFSKAFNEPPSFDLCICDLTLSELYLLPNIYRHLAPLMRSGGATVAFHLNADASPLGNINSLVGQILVLEGVVASFLYAGSRLSAASIRRFRSMIGGQPANRMIWLARFGLRLLEVAPRALIANLVEKYRSPARLANVPAQCTSIVVVLRHGTESEAE